MPRRDCKRHGPFGDGDDACTCYPSPQERQQEKDREVSRLLGYALFNLTKGNTRATETLVRKAYRALTGEEWDRDPDDEDYPTGIDPLTVVKAREVFQAFAAASFESLDAYEAWRRNPTLSNAIRRDDAAKKMNDLNAPASLAIAIIEEIGEQL